MSATSQIHVEIEELVLQGLDSKSISEKLNVPVDWVHAVEDDLESEFAN